MSATSHALLGFVAPSHHPLLWFVHVALELLHYFGALSRSLLYLLFARECHLPSGDLQQEVERRRSQNAYWSEAAIWMQFRQIVSAVAYLHSRNIIHRDLKTSNIFVAKDGALKAGLHGCNTFLLTPPPLFPAAW